MQEFNRSNSQKAQKNYTFQSKHITRVMSACLLPAIQVKYLAQLESGPFSLSFDEGSPRTGEKYLAINARYLPEQGATRTATKLVDLIELTGSCAGSSLKSLINKSLFSGRGGELRRKNLMGISTDGASNMINSQGAGVTNRFSEETPYLIIVHDYCHAFNLVLKYCISRFSPQIVDQTSKISEHFRRSSARTHRLTALIGGGLKGDRKIKTILKYVPTRWISFQESVALIVEIFGPLKQYFEEEGNETQKSYFSSENLLMLWLMNTLTSKVSMTIRELEKEDLNTLDVIRKLKLAIISIADFLFTFEDPIANDEITDEVEYRFKRLLPLLSESVTKTTKICKDSCVVRKAFKSTFCKCIRISNDLYRTKTTPIEKFTLLVLQSFLTRHLRQ